jgi:hypothetical protein
MKVFLDFEASSLSKDSYPVEIGWVGEDGEGEATLIRPAETWTEWDESAAVVHGIAREELERAGTDCAVVCARLIKLAEGNTLYASAPSWDGHWLSMLLRGAGLPRHLLRLRDSEEAFAEAARARAGTDADVAAIVAAARAKIDAEPPAHRALADARREWSIWRAIKDA